MWYICYMRKQMLSHYDLDIHEDMNVKVGTIDKKVPSSLYLNISTWVDVIDYDENKNYERVIRNIDKQIRQYIYNEIDTNIFHRDYIVDFDLRESGLSSSARNFLPIEITFFQKGRRTFKQENMVLELKEKANYICKEILIKNNNFNFNRKK